MADRVLVMHEGRIARELTRDEADEESVVRAATGAAGGRVTAQAAERRAGPAAPRSSAVVDRHDRARPRGQPDRRPRDPRDRASRSPSRASSTRRTCATSCSTSRSSRCSPSVRRSSSSPATSTSASARCSASPRSRPACCSPTTAGRSRSCSSPGCCSARFFGLMNGVMVAWARVPSLVITLGTLYVIRGIDFAWAQRPPDQRRRHARRLPEPRHARRSSASRCCRCSRSSRWSSSASCSAARGWAASSTRSAPTRTPPCWPASACRRRVLGAFVASGAIAGLAGVLYASRYGTLDANAGNGIELAAVSAVVVGGVAIFGGSGTVYGAALGALLLATIRSRARDPAGQPVLGAGDQRRAAAARDRPRRLPRAAIGARTAQEELAPCLSSSTSSRAGRRSPSSCCSRRSSTATSTSEDFFTAGNLNSILSDIVGDRAHRAAADADHHRRRDRPVSVASVLGPHLRPDGLPVEPRLGDGDDHPGGPRRSAGWPARSTAC